MALYVPLAAWQSGFWAAPGLPPAGTKQSQSVASAHVFGAVSGNVHAYCRSAFGVGAAAPGFHSCPFFGSAVGLLAVGGVIPAPMRGTIDSIMCGSVGGTGAAVGLFGSNGTPRIVAHTFMSVICWALKKPLVRSIGSTAMSCHGTPTMPATKTRLLSRSPAHPMPIVRHAVVRSE